MTVEVTWSIDDGQRVLNAEPIDVTDIVDVYSSTSSGIGNGTDPARRG